MKTRHHLKSLGLILCVLFSISGMFGVSQASTLMHPVAMPEFTNQNPAQWFNSPPLQRDDLKGKVVLLDFWTFDCWNCYRSFPWLNNLEQEFANKPFQVIGIHSPEFDHERVAARVADKIKEFGLKHPVMMDNNFTYWEALSNRFWPTFYIIDKQGMLRHRFVGETKANTPKAEAIEAAIRHLLEK